MVWWKAFLSILGDGETGAVVVDAVVVDDPTAFPAAVNVVVQFDQSKREIAFSVRIPW